MNQLIRNQSMLVTSRLINCNCCNSQSGSNPNSVEFRIVDRHVAYSDYESGLLSCVWVDKHCTKTVSDSRN
jgi:hypothetical protein